MKNANMKLLGDRNWQYAVRYDYDTIYPGGYCQCPDYCRCSKIVNAKVKDVDAQFIAELLVKNWLETGMRLKQPSDRALLAYTVERVLTAGNVYLPENWDIRVVGGYYGQEVDKIRWTGPEQVDGNLTALTATNDTNEWVKISLIAEYGFMLDELDGATFDIATVNLDQIHVTRPAKPDRRKATDDNTPAGLVLDNGTGLRLIDGHHRFTNLRHANRAKALYIVARTGNSAPNMPPSARRKTASTPATAALTALAALADSDTFQLTRSEQNMLRDITARLCPTPDEKQ